MRLLIMQALVCLSIQQWDIGLPMISSLHVQSLLLPPLFLFSHLKLYAKFMTTSVSLLSASFNSSQASQQRQIKINVILKIPSARSQFTLRLEVEIVNMRVDPVQIPVNLDSYSHFRQLEFVFLTELGKASLLVNLIQQIYLPKEETLIKQQDAQNSYNSVSEAQKDSNLSHSSTSSYQQQGYLLNGDSMKHNGLLQKEELLRKKSRLQERIKRQEQKLSLSRKEYMRLQLEQASERG